jgi:hypothetical protein
LRKRQKNFQKLISTGRKGNDKEGTKIFYQHYRRICTISEWKPG